MFFIHRMATWRSGRKDPLGILLWQILSHPFRRHDAAACYIHISHYEFFCLDRVDGIAITAQSSHSGGSPMSQRECAGFNWPPAVIPAEEPVSSSPEAVSRAGAVSQKPM